MKFCDFVIPKEIDEACSILKELGDAALPIAGGTAFHFYTDESIETAVNLSHLGLSGIEQVEGGFNIGATTTLSELVDYKADGWVLNQVCRHISTQQVRNISTIGGNIARVFPWSDLAIVLQALQAVMTLKGDTEERIPADEYFKTQPARLYKDGKLLLSIFVPAINKPCGFGHRKEQRTAKAFGMMTSSVVIELNGNLINDIQIALGAGIPFPRRITKLEQALIGQPADQSTFPEIIASNTDLVKWVGKEGMSQEYAAQLGKVVLLDALTDALNNAGGEENA